MTNTHGIAVSAALAALLGTAAQAQTTTFDNTGLRGDSAVQEANENLAEDIEDDFDRETRRVKAARTECDDLYAHRHAEVGARA